MMLKFYFCMIMSAFSQWSFSQLTTFSLSDIERLQTKEERKTIVFIQAQWCQYCKLMQKVTFKNQSVLQELNANFYVAILDAEEQKSINILGQNYHYQSSGLNTGVHQLAQIFGTIDGELSYPTLVILDSQFKILFQKAGFLDSKDLMSIINTAKTLY